MESRNPVRWETRDQEADACAQARGFNSREEMFAYFERRNAAMAGNHDELGEFRAIVARMKDAI
jgi:hypothetical protein